MQPARVYGDIVQRRGSGQLGPIRPQRSYTEHPTRGSAIVPNPRAQPYDLQGAMLRRATSRMHPLHSSPWNGHIEITDECKLGLALFQIVSPTRTVKNMLVPFKDGTRSKRVEIHLISDYSKVSTLLFRNGYAITLADAMLRHMEDMGLEQYLTEYTLVSQLLDKIMRIEAVRDRWIPTFSPPLRALSALLNQELEVPLIGMGFDISGSYIFQPRTLGQWFLKLFMERVRRQVTSGIGLRTLLYCVCWCARLISDHDYDRLRASATMIKAWLLQSTCQDCVYKFLRELREDVAFEYILNIADSFSDCITLPDLRTTLKIGTCGDSTPGSESQPGFLRTFGQHSFLTSPYANTSLPVRVKLLEGENPKTFKMTGRQTASLLIMLDLHARVLRARGWKQCRRAFFASLRERRANDSHSLVLVVTQIAEDLRGLSLTSAGLATIVAHFAPLLFTGRLSAEMVSAYNHARNEENVSAQRFIVRYSFLRAPTPDTQFYAESMLSSFIEKDAEGRRSMLEYTIEEDEFQYKLSKDEIDIEERWSIVGSLPEEDIVNEYTGDTLTFTRRADDAAGSVIDEPASEPFDQRSVSEVPFALSIHEEEDVLSLTGSEIAMIEDRPPQTALSNEQTFMDANDQTLTNASAFSTFRDTPRAESSVSSSTVIEPDDASSVGHAILERDSLSQ